MKNYQDLVKKVTLEGVTNEGTRSLFGERLVFNLRELPDQHSEELNWFLSGSTDTQDLETGVWQGLQGDLGRIYGYQWEKQLSLVEDLIVSDPTSSQLIVDCWQVDDLEYMEVLPTHMMFQLYVRNGVLSLQLYVREIDLAKLPDIISLYALLVRRLAETHRLEAGMLTICLGDAWVVL